eukprot:74222-Chlamydomonas_euryale.AAC.3
MGTCAGRQAGGQTARQASRRAGRWVGPAASMDLCVSPSLPSCCLLSTPHRTTCHEKQKPPHTHTICRLAPPHVRAQKDYCPEVFRKLRQSWDVNDGQYMLSLAGSAALWQLNSPGKSGAHRMAKNTAGSGGGGRVAVSRGCLNKLVPALSCGAAADRAGHARLREYTHDQYAMTFKWPEFVRILQCKAEHPSEGGKGKVGGSALPARYRFWK